MLTTLTLHHRNFFERRVSEYQKAGVMSSVAKNNSSDDIMNQNEFSLEADFEGVLFIKRDHYS